MNQQFYKSMALWVVVLIAILLVVTMFRQNQAAPAEISFSSFQQKLDGGEIQKVTIESSHISGELKSGGEFATYAPAVTEGLLEELKSKNVEVTARPARESSFWQTLLISWLPMLLFI